MYHTRVGQLVRFFLVVTIADSLADAGEASSLSDDPVKFVFFGWWPALRLEPSGKLQEVVLSGRSPAHLVVM